MVHTIRLDNYTPTPRKLVLGTNSSFGTESIKIERGAGWNGLNLTATWHIPGREEPLRVALLDGDAMDVPPEVTKEAKDGVLVLAGLASGVQRASCNVEYLILEQAGVYGGADAEPTPELAAQVLEAALQAKADAEAAAEDAAAAKANADKAQSDAEKAQQAAEKAAADAAKAGPYAEAARAAQEAAESARDKANAAQQAAENAAAAAAASKSAADTLAAEAARAAQAAENSKAAANNAANLAGENATAAQQAAATATSAANDAVQSASGAAANKAAAETAAKASQGAQTAAAEAKAEAVKAQGAAQMAAKSAQDAQAAAVAAQKDAAASKAAAANSAAAAKTSEDAAAKSAADADRTANSINDSMMQIAANKEAVSQLKEDTAALQKRQNVLVGSETGNPIAVDDAFASPLCGLTVYGKSTQDGTPTPDNPVPIVSAGDSGSVVVKVTGANMLEGTKPGVQSTVYGITYTIDENGVLITGTATNDFTVLLHDDNKYRLTHGIYYLTTKGLSPSTMINFYFISKFSSDVQNQKVTLNRDVEFSLSLQILKGATLNTTVQVSLTRNKITTYSPYREQLLTLPTPNGLPGIPVTSGGNYTDQNGQQWVCDEVDLERGVKVQRVKVLDITNASLRPYGVNNSYWYISSTLSDCSLNNSGVRAHTAIMCQQFPVVSQSDETKYSYPIVSPYGHADKTELRFRAPEALYATIEDFQQTIVGTKVYYPLATPIETPLTPAEIAAYKALTAYAPDTVVQASDGAGVKLEYQRDVNIVIKKFEDAIASMTTT